MTIGHCLFIIVIVSSWQAGRLFSKLFDLSGKVALVMGNELRGLSKEALDNADVKVRVPMVGFTESLNISVCAAVSMNILLSRLKESQIATGLTLAEKDQLRLEWYRKCVRGSDIIEREFTRNYNNAST